MLGKVVLEPVEPERGRPYYVAHTAIDTFVLVEPSGPSGGSDGGSGSLRWWTRNDSIRTLVRTPIEADFIEVFEPPRYQAIAPQAAKLRRLGYPDNLIAACTGVTDKTVAKAIRWFENRSSALD